MAAPGNVVSYRLLPLLLLLTPFLLWSATATQKVTYKCLKRGGGLSSIVVFVVISSENVTDIFGRGHEATCGLKAKNFTGFGNDNNPYRLFVDVSGIGDVTNGVCGIDKKGDVVDLTIITRTSNGTYANNLDKEANIKCDFSKDVLSNLAQQVNLVQQPTIEEKVNITLKFDGSPSELTVGTETFLRMSVVNPKRFQVDYPYKCWAMRNATDVNKVLILDNYCPVSSSPARIEFKNDNSYSDHISNKFPVFRFFGSNMLYIRCIVDLCVDPQVCFEPNKCAKKRKRSVSGGDRPRHLATTYTSLIVKDKASSKLFETGAQIPFVGTLFPISVFLVVILIAAVIGLTMKLIRRKHLIPTEEY